MAKLQVVGSAEEVEHWLDRLRAAGLVAAATAAKPIDGHPGTVFVSINPQEPSVPPAHKPSPKTAPNPGTAAPGGPTRRAPTAEQEAIRAVGRRLRAGQAAKIEAYAGAGKTTTLRMVARDRERSRLLYLAFNKRQQEEAKTSFPPNVEARTAHALAWRALRMSETQVRPRLFGSEVAECLGLPSRWAGLTSSQLGELVAATLDRFLQSAARAVSPEHAVLPVDEGGDSERERMVGWAQQLWDLQTEGRAPITHDSYLKSWHLNLLEGRLAPPKYDVVLFDEAQDANPVMIDVVRLFRDAAVVWVGDSYQQIYEWRGAVDALQQIEGESLTLSQSFRFGQPIANAALDLLRHHPRPPRVPLIGNPARESSIQWGAAGDVKPQAILARSRAGVLEAAFHAARSSRVHVVGGVAEIKAVMESACWLYEGLREKVTVPTIARFASWQDLTKHVETSKDRELIFVAREVTRRGPEDVRHMLARVAAAQVEADRADVTLSTVHRAKGLEWGCVQLMDDILGCEEIEQKLFKDPRPKSPEDLAAEMHVSYVAVTRAVETLIVPPGLLPAPRPARQAPEPA